MALEQTKNLKKLKETLFVLESVWNTLILLYCKADPSMNLFTSTKSSLLGSSRKSFL